MRRVLHYTTPGMIWARSPELNRDYASVGEDGIEPPQPKRLVYSQVGSTNAQLSPCRVTVGTRVVFLPPTTRDTG